MRMAASIVALVIVAVVVLAIVVVVLVLVVVVIIPAVLLVRVVGVGIVVTTEKTSARQSWRTRKTNHHIRFIVVAIALLLATTVVGVVVLLTMVVIVLLVVLVVRVGVALLRAVAVIIVMTLAVTLGLAMALLISRHAGRSVCGARRALENGIRDTGGYVVRQSVKSWRPPTAKLMGAYRINSSWKAFRAKFSGRELSTNARSSDKNSRARCGGRVCCLGPCKA